MKLIYLFGQPGSGKTTLASRLKIILGPGPRFCIDGDKIRELTNNKDYTITGRIENIEFAHRLALLALDQDMDVIISLVSPYEQIRDDFKKQCIEKGIDPIFVYLHYDKEIDVRGREQNWVQEFQIGKSLDLQLNTSMHTIGWCLDSIHKKIYK